MLHGVARRALQDLRDELPDHGPDADGREDAIEDEASGEELFGDDMAQYAPPAARVRARAGRCQESWPKTLRFEIAAHGPGARAVQALAAHWLTHTEHVSSNARARARGLKHFTDPSVPCPPLAPQGLPSHAAPGRL